MLIHRENQTKSINKETILTAVMINKNSDQDFERNEAIRKRKIIETKSIVNHAFENLVLMYPYWSSTIKTEDDLKAIKNVWLRAFILNGIDSYEQVELGLKKAYTEPSDFIPSITKFISWCKPENLSLREIGLPDEITAFRKACAYANNVIYGFSEHVSEIDIIKVAVVNSGISLIAEGTEQAKKRFEYEYHQLVKKYLKGESLLSSACSPLPSPKEVTYAKTSADIEFAKIKLDSIKKMLM